MFNEIDKKMDMLPLEKPTVQYVVVMDCPRHWTVTEDFHGIEDCYGNMSGVFSDPRDAQAHADQLNH